MKEKASELDESQEGEDYQLAEKLLKNGKIGLNLLVSNIEHQTAETKENDLHDVLVLLNQDEK